MKHSFDIDVTVVGADCMREVRWACVALGIETSHGGLVYWLCSFQMALYRGSNGWLGARSHAGTAH